MRVYLTRLFIICYCLWARVFTKQ